MWTSSQAQQAIPVIVYLIILISRIQGNDEDTLSLTIPTTNLYNLTKIEPNSISFVKKGRIAANVQEGHIMIDLKLKTIYNHVRHVELICEKMDNILEKSAYHDVHNDVIIEKEACQAMLTQMKSRQTELYNIFQKEYKLTEREKRFVGFLAGLLLGSVGTYTAMQLTDMRDSFRLSTNQEKIFTIIQDHEVRLTTVEQQVKDLNQTIAKIILDQGRVYETIEIKSLISKSMQIAALEYNHHGEITSAIMRLLNGDINPMLIKTETLQMSLRKLQGKAKEKGYSIPLERVEEVYQLPNDYIIETGTKYGEGTVTIFIHIPLVSKAKNMDLYQLSPIVLELWKGFSGIIDEPNYLAVSDDQTTFKILTKEELDHCTRLNPHHFYCLNNVLLKDFTSYCITAIYKNYVKIANQICDTKIIPQRAWAKQIDKDTFITYNKALSTIRIICGEKVFSENISGISKIQIPDCTAITDEFELVGHKIIEERDSLSTTTFKWNFDILKSNLSTEYIEETLTLLRTNHPVHVKDLRKQYDLQVVDHLFWHLPTYVILLVIILFLTTTCYFVYKQAQKRKEAAQRRRRGREEHPLNEAQ